MQVRVSLNDIVDALRMQTEDSFAFLDPDSGKVEQVSKDLISAAEDGENEDERYGRRSPRLAEAGMGDRASDRFRRPISATILTRLRLRPTRCIFVTSEMADNPRELAPAEQGTGNRFRHWTATR